jgi:hypothetical protein
MAWTERFVRSDAAGGGDGTTDTNSGANGAWTLAEAATAVTGGTRVNVRAGTYSLTTTTLSLAVEGTVASKIWWRGFNTSPGDLDSDFTTAKPVISFTSGHLAVSGDHQIFTNLQISGGSTNYNTLANGIGCHWYRCRFVFTSNVRVSIDATAQVFSQCYFQGPTTATRVVFINTGVATVVASSIVGGVSAIDGIGSAAGNTLLLNTVRESSSHGIAWTGNSYAAVVGNTIAGSGGDGIRISGSAAVGLCRNNLLVSSTGYGINATVGQPSVLFSHNAFHGNGSGETNGLVDAPSFHPVTESSAPLTNLAGDDLSLVAGALSRGAGLGDFENEIYTSYLDIGAVQSEGASGGGLLSGNLRGNMQ